MRILHTADWHLGKRLDFVSRLVEQKEVLDEICQITEQQEVDLVIVAGDLFDTFNPSVEATELLYNTLKRLTANGKRPVIAIAGNHDSPDRIDSADPLAKACGIIFIGYPNAVISPFASEDHFRLTKTDHGFLELQLQHIPYPIRLLTTPYANEIRLKQFLGIEDKSEQLNQWLSAHWKTLADQYCDHQGVNILTAHLYMMERGGEILEEPEGEKPIKIGNADITYTDGIPDAIQYTALGHLHRYQRIPGHHAPVIYPSAPLSYSFAEAGQTKKVVLIDIEPEQPVQLTPISLSKGRKLHRKKFNAVDEAVSWLIANPNTLIELTMVTDVYLSSQELKRLHEAHDGIVHIIPVLTGIHETTDSSSPVRLDQDIYSLFADYFKSKYGQSPNEEINTLFKEVLTQNKDIEG
ncbi:metallophosphoesterase family protein [Sphingobacterium faecale]|uniref:Nuclease SbcCD subunit D n=1 Tax=Sphingobacterium faecale TaxID=2803775 RepID=A0ABS1QY19_9SPHI|nr:exonuclease subunit SbcD [Sphingobacterium faecale]MBL1407327.1 exonuclease subunit SbcD [Sphingobacterium faecale]